MRIRYYRSQRGDEPVRDYIAGLSARERDDWDEALTLLGLFWIGGAGIVTTAGR